MSLIVLCGATATAQYRFENWTADDGLPQNSVYSITQTRDGYLWLTTFDGLVRFDGVRFTIFDKSNTKGLRTNRFTALYEDGDGTLWAGTGDGGLTLYREGVFTSYAADDAPTPPGEVMSFDRDLKGELLVRVGGGQFYPRDGGFTPAPPEYQAQDVRLYLAPSGTQWTISKDGATQAGGGRVTRYPPAPGFGSWVWPYEDSRGGLWLGTRSGLYRLRDGNGAVAVLATASNTVVTTIPVGANPYGLAVTPNGASVYVVNNSDSTVSVISTATNTVTATIPVGEVGVGPLYVAFAVRTNGPTGIDQCKQGGWQTFTNPKFKNQGDCVSFVNRMNHSR